MNRRFASLVPNLVVVLPLFPMAWPIVAALGARPKPDACPLITAAEIEAVQGAPVTATKGSSPRRPTLDVAQCFYTVATFSKSVSLEVARRDPKASPWDTPRARFKKLFHRAASDTGEEDARPPRPVPGVGDEAFWMGNAVTGGLYVLKDDAYLRISVGGSDDEPAKIEKAARLAREALARL
jgi:hypothetical protein